MICFKVALHETDVRSAAQEQRKKKTLSCGKKKYTHKFVKRILPLFFYLGEQVCAPTNLRNVLQMGYVMPNVYQESCVAARVSAAPQGGV